MFVPPFRNKRINRINFFFFFFFLNRTVIAYLCNEIEKLIKSGIRITTFHRYICIIRLELRLRELDNCTIEVRIIEVSTSLSRYL